MYALTGLKQKSKNLKNRIFVAGPIAVVGVVGVAGTASAAIDLTGITASIAGAISDITAAGLLLVGAYASVWVIKELVILFRK